MHFPLETLICFTFPLLLVAGFKYITFEDLNILKTG